MGDVGVQVEVAQSSAVESNGKEGDGGREIVSETLSPGRGVDGICDNREVTYFRKDGGGEGGVGKS